jgi:hypothetical protein
MSKFDTEPWEIVVVVVVIVWVLALLLSELHA